MKIVRRIAIAVLCVVVLVITPMIYHLRPLIPSSAYQAEYVEGHSSPHEARVYRMLFRQQVFIRLPTCSDLRYEWFAVDLDRRIVVSPMGPPGRSPYLHYNHDMRLGVAVDDDLKRSGEWRVRWSDGAVTWSNGDVTVRLDGIRA